MIKASPGMWFERLTALSGRFVVWLYCFKCLNLKGNVFTFDAGPGDRRVRQLSGWAQTNIRVQKFREIHLQAGSCEVLKMIINLKSYWKSVHPHWPWGVQSHVPCLRQRKWKEAARLPDSEGQCTKQSCGPNTEEIKGSPIPPSPCLFLSFSPGTLKQACSKYQCDQIMSLFCTTWFWLQRCCCPVLSVLLDLIFERNQSIAKKWLLTVSVRYIKNMIFKSLTWKSSEYKKKKTTWWSWNTT